MANWRLDFLKILEWHEIFKMWKKRKQKPYLRLWPNDVCIYMYLKTPKHETPYIAKYVQKCKSSCSS